MKLPWLSLAILVGCSSSAPTTTGGSRVTGVTVVAPAEVTGGLRVQLQATVQGSTPDKTVRWSVDGGGTLADTGANPAVYVAPLVTSPTTVHVRATSSVDGTKSGSADIRVVPAVPLVTTVDPNPHPVTAERCPTGRGLRSPSPRPVTPPASRPTSSWAQFLLRPKASADLASFLQRYQGVVLTDDSIPEPPASLGVTLTAAQRQARTFLVRINLAAAVDQLHHRRRRNRTGGAAVFSSEDGLRSMAIVTNALASGYDAAPNNLAGQDVFPSILLKTEERAVMAGGSTIPFTATPNYSRFWATGSQSNVTLAWQFLSARGITRRVRVAIDPARVLARCWRVSLWGPTATCRPARSSTISMATDPSPTDPVQPNAAERVRATGMATTRRESRWG